MAFRPSAFQRRILEFMKTALLEGLPGLDKKGRLQRGVTIQARDAVHDVWIRAALMPVDHSRVGRFRWQLERAIEELRLRRCIEPVEGRVKTSVWRWRRPDGNSVLLAYRRGRKGFDVEMNVGRIQRGKLAGVGTLASAQTPTYYRLLPEGFAVLDRMTRRVRASHKSPGGRKKKRLPRVEQPIGSAIEVDEQTFTIRAEGKTCRYTARGKLLFALLKRVAERPGHRVLYDQLRQKDDVWNGEGATDGTIKGAVHRLRAFLRSRGLRETARRLVTGTVERSKYVMLDVPDAEP